MEAHIAQYLVEENKYLLRENKVYDNVSCIDNELLFQFLEATQPKAVAKLKVYHKDLYEQKIVKRLNDRYLRQKELLKYYGKALQMALPILS